MSAVDISLKEWEMSAVGISLKEWEMPLRHQLQCPSGISHHFATDPSV